MRCITRMRVVELFVVFLAASNWPMHAFSAVEEIHHRLKDQINLPSLAKPLHHSAPSLHSPSRTSSAPASRDISINDTDKVIKTAAVSGMHTFSATPRVKAHSVSNTKQIVGVVTTSRVARGDVDVSHSLYGNPLLGECRDDQKGTPHRLIKLTFFFRIASLNARRTPSVWHLTGAPSPGGVPTTNQDLTARSIPFRVDGL